MTTNEAIFHLALMGMYADQKLALDEDTRITQMLGDLNLGEDSGERSKLICMAFATVRQASESEEHSAAFISEQLNPALPSAEDKARALAYLSQMLQADSRQGDSEKGFYRLAEWLLK